MKTINLGLLYIGGILVTILPLLIILVINWENYVIAAGYQPARVAIGGIGLIALIACSALGKLKIPNRIVFYTILLAILWCLKPIMNDIILLVGMILIGELVYQMTFRIWIRKYKEKIFIGREVKANQKVTQKIVDEAVKKLQGKV